MEGLLSHYDELLHMVAECVRRIYDLNPEFRSVRSLGRINELCRVVDRCVSQSMIYNLPWKGLSGMADYSFSKTDKSKSLPEAAEYSPP